MSRASQKGHEGEAGVRDFLNMWFPYYESAGIGADIVTSKGSRDEGDISGIPWTCIEVKNHSNPVVGTLLDNAEWKSDNSGRPVWFLVYKRKGYGAFRAFGWHVCTTVSGFLSGIQPVRYEEGTPSPAFELDHIEELCYSESDLDVDIGATYPGTHDPKYRWNVRMMFRPFMRGIEEQRNELFDDHGLDEMIRRVPVIIHPRVSRPVSDWYVYTRLSGQARILETIGLIPQDLADYEVDESVDDGVLVAQDNQ